MKSITAAELNEKLKGKEDLVLIDVREPFENEAYNIGGLLIPMNTVFDNLSQIPKEKPVVIYCAKGIRSMIVIQRLEEKFGYSNLLNLSGGIHAWKKETE